ncbi:MAG: TolC family protein [Acidobacteriota bacterium]|nr:TolC family protein [Acidobacteriota bacterium]
MTTHLPGRCRLSFASITFVLLLALAFGPAARAQLSLVSAVDLAIRNSPRVKGAEADHDKARAQVSEALDAYVPIITAGAGLGQGYGYSPNPPTLATVSGGSLVYNASQSYYIKSAREGLAASRLALADAREAVAQDAAIAFISLVHDQQRAQVIGQQSDYAKSLATIVQNRLDAGQDTPIDLTQAKLTAAELHLAQMKAQDDAAYDREHLGRLIGIPPAALSIDENFPSIPIPDEAENTTPHGYANSAVASAFSSAEAKLMQAEGLNRFRFRPEFNMIAQYNRYATFTDSFASLQRLNGTIKANEGVFGVQITIPFFDKGRAAKAREAAADASRSFHDAESAQMDALDSQSRLRHTIDEINAQADVATLQQQLAQQQLDILHLQLQSPPADPNAPQMTPKDEQKSRIAERDKYLNVIDAGFQLRQAEIQLLRQTGGLEVWLKSASASQSDLPGSPTNRP